MPIGAKRSGGTCCSLNQHPTQMEAPPYPLSSRPERSGVGGPAVSLSQHPTLDGNAPHSVATLPDQAVPSFNRNCLNDPPAIFTVRLFLSSDFLFAVAFLPICLVATIGRLAVLPSYWPASLIWPAVIIVLAFYAHLCCSSDRMRFRDGLLWVTASMMTGWVYMSFLTV